jgi:hypothetical protein
MDGMAMNVGRSEWWVGTKDSLVNRDLGHRFARRAASGAGLQGWACPARARRSQAGSAPAGRVGGAWCCFRCLVVKEQASRRAGGKDVRRVQRRKHGARRELRSGVDRDTARIPVVVRRCPPNRYGAIERRSAPGQDRAARLTSPTRNPSCGPPILKAPDAAMPAMPAGFPGP